MKYRGIYFLKIKSETVDFQSSFQEQNSWTFKIEHNENK